MRHSTLLSAVAGLLLLAGATAKAETFSFTFGSTGSAFSGSGILVGNVDPDYPGAYAITSATGQINGSAIELAAPTDGSGNVVTDPSGLYNVDQVIFTGPGGNNGVRGGDVGSVVDNEGLLFESIVGGQLFNIFSGNPGEVTIPSGPTYSEAFLDAPMLSLTVIDKPSIAATPEPSSLMLFGTGIFGVAGMLRRRVTGK